MFIEIWTHEPVINILKSSNLVRKRKLDKMTIKFPTSNGSQAISYCATCHWFGEPAPHINFKNTGSRPYNRGRSQLSTFMYSYRAY